MKFTNEQIAKEAEREVQMRKQVYGKKGHMTAVEIKRIEIMEEIAAHFWRLAELERIL